MSGICGSSRLWSNASVALCPSGQLIKAPQVGQRAERREEEAGLGEEAICLARTPQSLQGFRRHGRTLGLKERTPQCLGPFPGHQGLLQRPIHLARAEGNQGANPTHLRPTDRVARFLGEAVRSIERLACHIQVAGRQGNLGTPGKHQAEKSRIAGQGGVADSVFRGPARFIR
jgi:hypothetical protein